MDTSKKVAAALRDARKAANMSQGDLSLLLGVSKQFLSRVELGRDPLPRSLYAKLPESIRWAVINARRAELAAEAQELAGIM